MNSFCLINQLWLDKFLWESAVWCLQDQSKEICGDSEVIEIDEGKLGKENLMWEGWWKVSGYLGGPSINLAVFS